jgi:peptidoglycan/xylan/chitin deacetylase (PgdA/CDA1 family)
MRGIVAALRELMKQKEVSAHSYDLVAYIGLSLLKIDANIDQSVVAWEKRDYWVKADRFRMEWAWAGSVGKDILQALEANDWARIAGDAIKVGQKLSTVKVTERSRIGTPWVGAYQLLKK